MTRGFDTTSTEAERDAPSTPLPRLTASKLELVRACPGSFALTPHVSPVPGEAAEKGTAIHAYIEALLDGVSEPQLPDGAPARSVCQRLDARELYALAGPEADDPAERSGDATHLSEQPLAWDPETGGGLVVRSPDNPAGRRDYSAVPEGWVSGTADVIALWDGAVKVTDFKTGAGEVLHPAENPQLLFLGLAAARAFGRERAVVQIVHVGDDGSLRPRRAELGPEDLGRAEQGLETDVARIERSRKGTPELRPGRHCRFCPALHLCPAIAGEAQSLLEQPLEELDPQAVREAWRRLQAVEAAAKRAKEALTLYVAGRGGEPLDLGDGRSLKLAEGTRQNLDPAVALRIVSERFGEEAAFGAASVSPSSLKKTLADDDAREILREVEEKGGVRTNTYEYLREGKGRPATP